MGIFDFFKRNGKPKPPERSNILLAMPLFINNEGYKLADIINILTDFWGLKVSDRAGDDEAATFVIEGETVALANMPVPIPGEDIEGAAKYAFNWPSAFVELEAHTGHAIVSMLGSQAPPAKRFRILSKVLGAILMGTNAVGIYQGSQSLIIPREQYLDQARWLLSDGNPISLWIYIGLKRSREGNSAYTYGLRDFGKKEIEIIGSKLELASLFDLLYNISSYVIANDVTLKPGETVGMTKDQKIPIRFSKAEFVEGESIKLDV